MLDKFMEKLSSALSWLPSLGFGIEWQIGGKTVKLWPFVAVALVIIALRAVF